MDFEATLTLINALRSFLEHTSVHNESNGKSDLVIIDEVNNVGFEVFKDEIIVFYFTDHEHFEDYTSELREGQEDYIMRAKAFLLELFTYKIRHIKYFKGSTLSSEKYFLLYDDGRDDVCIGNTWFGLSSFINPFGKKSERSITWMFDREKGMFTTHLPKVKAFDAIEVIDINDDCFVEICKKDDFYTYSITESAYDDYHGLYYWAPAANIVNSGYYDTKEKAIQNAMEALNLRDDPLDKEE